ncbi:MAG: amidohydrolase family protein [Myxococcota bacterium]
MGQKLAAGWIDYWCNGFAPAMQERWNHAITEQGIPLKIRRDEHDSFVDVTGMIARMNELEIKSLVLPCADVSDHSDPLAYERFTTPIQDIIEFDSKFPQRFPGLFTIDPSLGSEGVARAAEVVAQPGFVGLHLHTHSWDRTLDHRDLYPFYALAADLDLPFIVQVGTSGGRAPSECGRPMGIDRPALYFDRLRFVLSHTGWPWVDEAIAMAMKHPNVYLGTAAYPPHHWSSDLVRFIRGAGRGKVLLGTSFPVVGHRHALTRLADLKLDPETEEDLTAGAARRVFTRLER